MLSKCSLTMLIVHKAVGPVLNHTHVIMHLEFPSSATPGHALPVVWILKQSFNYSGGVQEMLHHVHALDSEKTDKFNLSTGMVNKYNYLYMVSLTRKFQIDQVSSLKKTLYVLDINNF